MAHKMSRALGYENLKGNIIPKGRASFKEGLLKLSLFCIMSEKEIQ